MLSLYHPNLNPKELEFLCGKALLESLNWKIKIIFKSDEGDLQGKYKL